MPDSAPREMLRIAGLHAFYGESHILHGIDLTVGEGEVVTLLGRNGAGRSTILKSITGLVGRRAGSITVNGVETIKMPTHKIARLGIGYCPEERGIFSSLSVEENLLLPPVVQPGGMSLPEIYAMFPNLEERRATLECKVQDQQSTIHAMQPKAAFHDAVAITANSRTIEEVSKAFGSGLVRFYEWLRGEKIMLRNNREHLPYQEVLDRGYFEVKEGTFDVRAKSGLMEKRTYIKTMVTAKGQLWLHKRFTKQVEA